MTKPFDEMRELKDLFYKIKEILELGPSLILCRLEVNKTKALARLSFFCRNLGLISDN